MGSLLMVKESFVVLKDLTKWLSTRNVLESLQMPITELFKVGGMKMDERLLAYTIAWIFLARGGNHATLMIGDLIAIQTMKDKVKFD